MADGWIEWRGGERPVDKHDEVRIRFWDGETEIDEAGAFFWDWRTKGLGGDITAYQVVRAAGGKRLAKVGLAPRALFDATSSLQEELAINIAAQIANGVRPDAVQVIEWAAALYEAEVGAA